MALGCKLNALSFFKSYIIENSILCFMLFSLEKLMDLEFKCPKDNTLGLVYGMVFFFAPTGIVAIVAFHFNSQKRWCIPHDKGNGPAGEEDTQSRQRSGNVPAGGEDTQSRQRSGNVPAGEEDTQNPLLSENVPAGRKDEAIQSKTTECSCCKPIICFFFNYKVPIIWLLIIITDGQYLECLVKSAADLAETNRTRTDPPLDWTTIKDNYLKSIFQIVGVLLIFLVFLLLFCIPKCKCKWAQRCDELINEAEMGLRKAATDKQKEVLHPPVVTIPKCKNWREHGECSTHLQKDTVMKDFTEMKEMASVSPQEHPAPSNATLAGNASQQESSVDEA
ncbi:uncharacterized protein [Hyperolius riggenbachi]|uniref:uncharacterized protein n=1 Tax=Hyperolius riggenbachi TaxID=752182 RepID=UPI0035A28A9A